MSALRISNESNLLNVYVAFLCVFSWNPHLELFVFHSVSPCILFWGPEQICSLLNSSPLPVAFCKVVFNSFVHLCTRHQAGNTWPAITLSQARGVIEQHLLECVYVCLCKRHRVLVHLSVLWAMLRCVDCTKYDLQVCGAWTTLESVWKKRFLSAASCWGQVIVCVSEKVLHLIN